MMNYTLLDVAVTPMEQFAYEASNSNLPIFLIIAGVIAVASITYFFIKYRNNEKEQDEDR